MTDACRLTWDAPFIADFAPVRKTKTRVVRFIDRKSLLVECARKRVKADLKALAELDENWDGYGAPRVSRKAISNCRRTLRVIDPFLYSRICLRQNDWGGVQLHYKSVGGFLCCDFGDDTMSYYVQRKDGDMEWFSFISYDADCLSDLGRMMLDLS